MERSQATSCMLCLYCTDAQVAQGGSQGAFLSITQCSLIHTAYINHGQGDRSKTLKT